MKIPDERAHKSIFARAESGGNGRKALEKRFLASSGPRGNENKTARWSVLSKFLRPKQGVSGVTARETTRLGPSCVGNSRQVGATGGGQRCVQASWQSQLGSHPTRRVVKANSEKQALCLLLLFLLRIRQSETMGKLRCSYT